MKKEIPDTAPESSDNPDSLESCFTEDTSDSDEVLDSLPSSRVRA